MKQFVFTYNEEKYITLVGAGEYLSTAKITPNANVGIYNNMMSAGYKKAFRSDFGITVLAAPIIVSMSHCSCTNEGVFTIHGRYIGDDGKEHAVDIMPDRIVDSADKPVEQQIVEDLIESEHEPEPIKVVASAPSATTATASVTRHKDDTPTTAIKEVPQVSGSEVFGMTLGKKKKKKKGISFGETRVVPVVRDAEERRASEQLLGSFPTRPVEPKNEPVAEEVIPTAETVVQESATDDLMKRLSNGQSALEALSTFKDSPIVTLPKEQIDILEIIPLSILHMSSKFVNRRAGINFDALAEDGVDYCRANEWQLCDGWWCIDILETAERVFYNSADGCVYEFDSVICKDMYMKRTEDIK